MVAKIYKLVKVLLSVDCWGLSVPCVIKYFIYCTVALGSTRYSIDCGLWSTVKLKKTSSVVHFHCIRIISYNDGIFLLLIIASSFVWQKISFHLECLWPLWWGDRFKIKDSLHYALLGCSKTWKPLLACGHC